MKIIFVKTAALSLVLAVLIVILLNSYGIIDYTDLTKYFEDKDSFLIEDECGSVLGNVLHSVPDLETCSLKCQNSCNTYGKGFKKSEFVSENPILCNKCECFCY